MKLDESSLQKQEERERTGRSDTAFVCSASLEDGWWDLHASELGDPHGLSVGSVVILHIKKNNDQHEPNENDRRKTKTGNAQDQP